MFYHFVFLHDTRMVPKHRYPSANFWTFCIVIKLVLPTCCVVCFEIESTKTIHVSHEDICRIWHEKPDIRLNQINQIIQDTMLPQVLEKVCL